MWKQADVIVLHKPDTNLTLLLVDCQSQVKYTKNIFKTNYSDNYINTLIYIELSLKTKIFLLNTVYKVNILGQEII